MSTRDEMYEFAEQKLDEVLGKLMSIDDAYQPASKSRYLQEAAKWGIVVTALRP